MVCDSAGLHHRAVVTPSWPRCWEVLYRVRYCSLISHALEVYILPVTTMTTLINMLEHIGKSSEDVGHVTMTHTRLGRKERWMERDFFGRLPSLYMSTPSTPTHEYCRSIRVSYIHSIDLQID